MIIRNSDHQIISADAQYARDIYTRVLGLIDPHHSRFLIINTRFGIHTFFLRSPIDVVILDNNNQVLDLRSALSPNRFFFYNPRCSIVIEMPKGTISQWGITLNDKIFIE